MTSDEIQASPGRGKILDFAADSPPRLAVESRPVEEHLEILAPQPGAMEVFIAWEKLRLLYNAILAGLVVWYLTPFAALHVGPVLLFDALMANLGFCAGPVAEGYLCLLGFPRKPTRWVIFGIGTALAAAQAIPVLQVMLQQWG
jgi:hypothetical protein